MGQKIHPGGMRVGIIHDWKSNWYTGTKDFSEYLLEDIRIREHIYNKLSHAGLSDILIRKDAQRITIDIYTARPGIVIGKSGVEVDALRKDVHGMTNKAVHININEIKRPELDAKLVAQSIAEQLANRVSFRRAMKRSLASAMRSGAHGVKIQCGGRLGGGEMSRSESYSEGRVPLHTIRADIDYGFVEAKTTFGRIGVKVWINKGEIMPEGYESVGQKDARLGDQDQARRKGGVAEGLGASREGGRGRGPDREGLGPVRQRKRGEGGGGGRPGGGRGRGGGRNRPGTGDRARGQDNVEKPRTDETATSAEGREQPVVEPQVEEIPRAVADAPDTTTEKTQTEDPTKLETSGDETAGKKKPAAKKPAAPKAAAKKPAAPKAAADKPAAKKPAAKKPAAKKKDDA
ncbi:MAG: 30S ribosomal protein S3 [Actinomycetota bacterium]|nr:30S ribosomal protein S3 [Actinomycetota bacterium]